MEGWVVVVDDEPLNLTHIRSILAGEKNRVTCLRSGGELLRFIQKSEPDVILLDVIMPEMDGFETYRRLRIFEEQNERNEIPVIFLTGDKDTETEHKGLKLGASDFIHK
ncbi:MAG: response regulator, partial [Lachnospiraceae bacterium]|nr:response regulator [Lachnospiraceae bacterium]